MRAIKRHTAHTRYRNAGGSTTAIQLVGNTAGSVGILVFGTPATAPFTTGDQVTYSKGDVIISGVVSSVIDMKGMSPAVKLVVPYSGTPPGIIMGGTVTGPGMLNIALPTKDSSGNTILYEDARSTTTAPAGTSYRPTEDIAGNPVTYADPLAPATVPAPKAKTTNASSWILFAVLGGVLLFGLKS
jgi:hypothetical protein